MVKPVEATATATDLMKAITRLETTRESTTVENMWKKDRKNPGSETK
jgi:hypothetical protein